MKKLLGSISAGLVIALAAAFLLTRTRGAASEHADVRGVSSEVLPDMEQIADTQQIAEEVRDAFVPEKVNGEQSAPGLLDLNSCSLQDLLGIGSLDPAWALRIVESRPYRNKLDLLSRMVVPIDVFTMISERISIAKPDEGVKIA